MSQHGSARAAAVIFIALTLAFPPALRARQTPQPTGAAAATRAGKVLTLADYPGWKRIQSADLSPDGKWMSYAYLPNEGDDTLFLRQLDGTKLYTIPNATTPVFSSDGRWVTYTISPPGRGGRGGRGGGRGGTPPGRGQGAAPQGGAQRRLELLELATGTKFDVPDVQSSAFSADAHYLAARRNKAARDSTHDGTDLVLRNLTDGTAQNIGNVSEYAFNRAGSILAWTVDAADDAGNGAFVLDLRSGVLNPLSTGASEYTQLSWNRDGNALAVLRGTKPAGQMYRQNTLLAFTGLGAKVATVEYDPTKDAAFPGGFVLSELGGVRWTRDNARIQLGIKQQESELPKTDEPQADLEVWHWKDADIQSVQKVRADQARRFTYTSVFDLGSRRFVRLADDDMRTVTLSGDGRWGVGRLDKPYRDQISWGGSRADYYRIDPATGDRQLMVSGLMRAMGSSPDGKWFVYLKDRKLQARDVASGRTVDLSALAGVSFVDTTDDHDYELPAYGIGGWTKDGKSVIVNHRFDLWLLPLEGGKAVNLTAGMGDAEQIQFRVQNLNGGGGFGGRGGGAGFGNADLEDRGIDITKPVLLSAYGEWTKKSGYYEVKAGSKPRPLIFEDRQIGQLSKADSTDRVIFTEQTFAEFPDYWLSNTSFAAPKKITDANPQLADYAWGRRILVDYTDQRGNRLQATLALPASYQAGRRYPMLVYFYEKLSQDHH